MAPPGRVLEQQLDVKGRGRQSHHENEACWRSGTGRVWEKGFQCKRYSVNREAGNGV